MPKTSRIKLVENLKDRSMCEKEPRYDVLLDGVKVDQLYFNMKGYRGSLPTPGGHRLDIGERSITQYRQEVARLNREFASK